MRHRARRLRRLTRKARKHECLTREELTTRQHNHLASRVRKLLSEGKVRIHVFYAGNGNYSVREMSRWDW